MASFAVYTDGSKNGDSVASSAVLYWWL